MTANRVQTWLDDGDLRLYHGDAITVLQGLPAGIAQTCVTSPPYWGLRDYAATGQIGLEALPQEYVERLVAVFREVRRVLRDDGTLWLNLGDSYAAGTQGRNDSGRDFTGGGGNYQSDAPGPRVNRVVPGLKPKDLVGIPWRVAFALQTDGWYLRSDIIWSKPNPMPESVTDRPTKSHEYLFLLTKQPRYYMDMDAIREPQHHDGRAQDRHTIGDNGHPNHFNREGRERWPDPAGRNRRSVWTIPTEPFPEAHFATYPQELVRPCILAGTSESGECAECGTPWTRRVDRKFYGNLRTSDNKDGHADLERGITRNEFGGQKRYSEYEPPETVGWAPSCTCMGGRSLSEGRTPSRDRPGCNSHPAPTPQLVLDPFVGSGTTALVARKHGRRCIGIDLSAEYLAIAANRTQQLSLLGGVA